MSSTQKKQSWGRRLKQRIDQKLEDRLEPDWWKRVREMDAGQNEYGYDPFGFNPEFLKYVSPAAEFIYRRYFRAQVHGLENLPDKGRVMLISNHSGQIALDGMIIGSACIYDKDPPRMVRSMVEHWVPTIPFVSSFMARAGQVTGTRENARILLGRGGCLLVFPEGVRGISKTYDRAYQLTEFGLGFMRLALETDTPIVPIGVVGGEEQIPSVVNLESVAKVLGLPALPITPHMLLMGPLGAAPLPVKYHVYFGKPLHFTGKPDDEDRVIREKVETVKDSIRSLLERGLEERRGIFF